MRVKWRIEVVSRNMKCEPVSRHGLGVRFMQIINNKCWTVVIGITHNINLLQKLGIERDTSRIDEFAHGEFFSAVAGGFEVDVDEVIGVFDGKEKF